MGVLFALGGEAAADIFCNGNGARLASLLQHVDRVADREVAATFRRRLGETRASCTACHQAPGPEPFLAKERVAPLNAYAQALTILRPSLVDAVAVGEVVGTEEAFTRVDRLPVDPADPGGPTYGDRLARGLPPYPLFPAGDDEPAKGGDRAARRPTSLTFEEAMGFALSPPGPVLQMSELAEVDARTAVGLARFDGRVLMLGLRSLPTDVAKNLAASRADTVWLHSLTEIEPDAAEALAGLPGDLVMTGLCRLESPALAAKLANRAGRLVLPFLRSVSTEAAAALVNRDDWLCLPALADVSPERQEALAAGRCRLDLPALRRLESPALARKLAASTLVFLGGLETLSVDVAKILCNPVEGRRGVVLSLAALTPEALAALGEVEPEVRTPAALGQCTFIGRELTAERLRALGALAPQVGQPARRALRTCLPEITELSDALAAVAAECDVAFPNLARLDSAALAAAMLKTDDAFLTLRSVQVITAPVAAEISRYKAVEALQLSSLRRLPLGVAEPLLQTTRSTVNLSGLEEISTDTLRLLLGRIRNDGSAAGLVLGVSRLPPGPFAPAAETRGKTMRFDLNLPALATLSADDARSLVAAMRPQGRLTIRVPRISAEAMDVLADWGGVLSLFGLESLPPEVARALARLPGGRGYLGSINLDEVKTPDMDSLAELAQAKRSFSFAGVSELTPELAKALVNCPTCVLQFPAVTSITPEVARVLVSGTGRRLALPGLTAVDAETAALLAACPGWDPNLPAVTSLTPQAATALAGFVSKLGELRLPGLTSLEPEVARVLAKCPRWLPGLNALKTLEPETAAALAGVNRGLVFSAVTQLTPETAAALAACPVALALPGLKTLEPEVAAALAACRGTLALPGLTRLDAEVAAALAKCPRWDGMLPRITAFESADSAAVAAALARKQGPLSLPALRRISPKTLTALVEKLDVQIPRIETLMIIAEPDGSATEDFVIPAEFQGQQQRQRR